MPSEHRQKESDGATRLRHRTRTHTRPHTDAASETCLRRLVPDISSVRLACCTNINMSRASPSSLLQNTLEFCQALLSAILPFAPKPIRTISGGYWNKFADSNSNFVAVKFFQNQFEFFGVFGVQSHTMWLYMCICCGLFVPTEFHFECRSVRHDS